MGIFFVVLVPSVIYLPIFYLIVQWYHRRQHRRQFTETGHAVAPSRTPLRILLLIANSFPLAFLLFMKLNDCLVPYLPCLTFNQNNLGILVFMALASGHALIYWLMQCLLGPPAAPSPTLNADPSTPA